MHVNNRVLVLREAITKIVPMLTQRSVKVTQRGTQAFVEYDKRTLAVKRLNLPYIPDDADDILLDATQGFLDHECGHILFTDQKCVLKAEKLKVHSLHNMIEDTFVERRMGENFPGCGSNLAKMHGFFLTEYIDAQLQQKPEHAGAILLVVAFRAWAGQPAFVDYMADKWALITDVTDRLGTDFPKMIRDVSSSESGLKLAVEARKRLEPNPPALPPVAPPPPPAAPTLPEPEPEPAPEPTEEPGTTGSPSALPEDDSAPPEDADDPDEEPDEPEAPNDLPPLGDEPEEPPAASGEPLQEPTPDPDDEDEDQDDEPAEPEAGAPGSGAPPEPEADPDADDDDDQDDDDGAAGDPGDGMPGGDAGEGEGEGDADDAAGAPDDSEGDSGQGDTPGGGGLPSEGDGTVPTPNPNDARDMFKEFEDAPVQDFDEAAAEALSKKVAEVTKGSDYAIFTRDEDVIFTMDPPEGFDQGRVTKMQKEVDHMVGPLQKDLQRAISARSASVYTGGHKSGKLHGASLSRILTGRDDVFRQKQVNKTKDVAVSLLVDASGSMNSYDKITIAAYTAYALASVLDNLGIPSEVLAFSTKDFSHGTCAAIEKEEREHGFNYARTSALNIAIIKSFTERVTPETRRRFAMLSTEDNGMMEENVDGESVQIAHRRLMSQRAGRKVLMVLSDGRPACGGSSAALNDHLTDIVKQIEARGTEVVALGILDESVKRFYKKAIVMNKVADLPTLVMRELHRLLVN